jgi:hypothetical protein
MGKSINKIQEKLINKVLDVNWHNSPTAENILLEHDIMELSK